MTSVSSLIKVLKPNEVKRRFIPKLETRMDELIPLVRRRRKGKQFYLTLTDRIEGLENFLDDFGAGENKDFVYLREVVASMRWFGKAAFAIEHVISRYPGYQAEECYKLPEFLTGKLEGYETVLRRLGKELVGENSRIKKKFLTKKRRISLKKKKTPVKKTIDFEPDTIQQEKIPADLDVQEVEGEKEQLAGVVQEYFTLSNEVSKVLAGKNLTEEKIERLEGWLHRLQTRYDSFVKNSDLERENPRLKRLRGHISLPLHLLEISGDLIHYCERHTNKIRHDKTGERINEIVKKEQMEKDVYEFFELAEFFISREKELARDILEKQGIDPDDYELHKLVVSLSKGDLESFHIRPFVPMSLIAGKYERESRLYANRREYDLKDTLDMATGVAYIRRTLAEQQDSLDLVIIAPKKALAEYATYMQEKFHVTVKPKEKYVCPITINSDNDE